MASSTFTPFSRLPIEVRHMIWGFAIWPRLVHIQEGTSFEKTITTRVANPVGFSSMFRGIYLFSTSPVPSLLQTCQDSRHAMKAHGYELMFRTDHFGPRIWFNPNYDIVYLQEGGDHYYKVIDFYQMRAQTIKPGSLSGLARAPLADLARLRRVALFRSSPYYKLKLGLFHCLEEILVVREHCGSQGSSDLCRKRDKEGDWWGYLECDVSDALGYCLPDGAQIAQHYSYQIWQYRRRMNTHGKDFFESLERECEEELRVDHEAERKAMLFPGTECVWVTHQGVRIEENRIPPKVKYVIVTNRNQASRLLQKRKNYWKSIEEEENRKPDFGPRQLPPDDIIEDALIQEVEGDLFEEAWASELNVEDF